MVISRSSPLEWSGSGKVKARGSRKTVAASSKEIWCFCRLPFAFLASHVGHSRSLPHSSRETKRPPKHRDGDREGVTASEIEHNEVAPSLQGGIFPRSTPRASAAHATTPCAAPRLIRARITSAKFLTTCTKTVQPTSCPGVPHALLCSSDCGGVPPLFRFQPRCKIKRSAR